MIKLYLLAICLLLLGTLGCQKKKNESLMSYPLISECNDPTVKALSKVEINQIIRKLPLAKVDSNEIKLKQLGKIPKPTDYTKDGPNYYVYVDNNDFFWLYIEDGFTGSYEWRGPFSIDINGIIICPEQKK